MSETMASPEVAKSLDGLQADRAGDTVVEEWHAPDGSSWFRRWRSGFLEQAGTASAAGYLRVCFPLPFKSANYFASATCCAGGSFYDRAAMTRTETRVVFDLQDSRSFKQIWYVCGY